MWSIDNNRRPCGWSLGVLVQARPFVRKRIHHSIDIVKTSLVWLYVVDAVLPLEESPFRISKDYIFSIKLTYNKWTCRIWFKLAAFPSTLP